MPFSQSCAFCNLRSVAERTRSYDTVIEEHHGFVTMPSLGAIVPGWLLVVSREHHLCSAALDRASHKLLLESVENAKGLLSHAFSAPTVFEHGPASPGTPVGCGIDHLHMHLVPLPGSLAKQCTELYGTEWQTLQHADDLSAMHREGVSYLSVQEPGASWLWASPPDGVRQPLRRAIAHMMNVPSLFDYRKDFFEENIAFTLKELSSAA
jgi:ATP adenylyltransferase